MPHPEFRRDPLTGTWVIVAENRLGRAGSLSFRRATRAHEAAARVCPFCPGNEAETPAEVDSLRPDRSAADRPGWRVRIFPNKYPAVLETIEHARLGDAPFEAINGFGRHELLIESPDHGRTFDALEQEQVEHVVRLMRRRVEVLMGVAGVRHVLVFKNHGREAGASRDHPHLQIVGQPIVPLRVAEEVAGFARHHADRGGCYLCDLIERERAAGARVVAEADGFMALCPWASRTPFEMLVAPVAHASDLRGADDASLRGLGAMLRLALGRLARGVDDPPYNMVVHTAPSGTPAESFHWHVEILPKLTTLAGFEWGTGSYINLLSPERAATALRRADRMEDWAAVGDGESEEATPRWVRLVGLEATEGGPATTEEGV